MSLQFEVFPIRLSPGNLIRRSSDEMKAGLHRAFRDQGLDFTSEQWALLNTLWEQEGLTQSQLAERAYKDRPNITRMLWVLERRGLVAKQEDSSDKRCYRVFLTQAGRKLQEILTPVVVNYLNRVFAGLSQSDLATLERIHRLILANAEAFQAKDR